MNIFPHLSGEALVRLSEIIRPLGPLPISKSSFWLWVAQGRLPKPYKPSPGISAWKVGELRAAFAAFKKGA